MFKPLQDRIVIKQDEGDEKVGSIIVPQGAREKPMKGTVVAVGPGRVIETGELIVPGVKAGDSVLFTKYAGTEVEVDGGTYLVVRESDLIGIVHSVEP